MSPPQCGSRDTLLPSPSPAGLTRGVPEDPALPLGGGGAQGWCPVLALAAQAGLAAEHAAVQELCVLPSPGDRSELEQGAQGLPTPAGTPTAPTAVLGALNPWLSLRAAGSESPITCPVTARQSKAIQGDWNFPTSTHLQKRKFLPLLHGPLSLGGSQREPLFPPAGGALPIWVV